MAAKRPAAIGKTRTNALAEELEMSHAEYTREDSRKDLSASLTGLVAGVVWVLIVGAIAYFLATRGG